MLQKAKALESQHADLAADSLREFFEGLAGEEELVGWMDM